MSIRLIRSLYHIQPSDQRCVATIGNFDGVHLGHQALLESVKSVATQRGLPSCVIVFEPQPNEYFQAAPPVRLSRLAEKLLFFERHGVDSVLCIRFNAAFVGLSAEAFIEEVLVKQIGVTHLTVGYDFRFGKNRLGDVNLLKNSGLALGFEVNSIAALKHDTQVISSTLIRKALEQGELSLANQWLGRPFTLVGRVIYGDQRGRQLGFPTANIALHRQTPPLRGVYAVTVTGAGLDAHPAVANIGFRPTVDGKRPLLEVHLLNYAGELYGQRLEIQFLKKIRDEQRFENLPALREQIDMDARTAHAFFESD